MMPRSTWIRAALAAVALGAPMAAVAQAKEPLTHEALFLLKRVGSPAVSPDGRWVTFSVSEPSYNEKKDASDLWIVPADGSAPPRRLTVSKGGESAPAWSPDSRRIAFATTREDDEVAQVYVIDVAGGGEARRVTSSPLAARAPVWSPDGRSIAFQAGAYPGAADAEANAKIVAERKAAKSKVRIYESYPIRRWDKWLDDTQTHLFVVSAEGGIARDLLAGSRLVAMPGFGGPTGEGAGEDIEPEWTPDSRGLVFAAMTNRDASAYAPTSAQLFEVAVAGGEPRPLTAGNAPSATRSPTTGRRSTRSCASDARPGRGARRGHPSPPPSTARSRSSPSRPTAGRCT
jgi:Tol biopolymer transport system component